MKEASPLNLGSEAYSGKAVVMEFDEQPMFFLKKTQKHKGYLQLNKL